jgi:hypothetical protein
VKSCRKSKLSYLLFLLMALRSWLKCSLSIAPTAASHSFMWTLLSRVSWSKPAGRRTVSLLDVREQLERAGILTVRAERDAAAAVLDTRPGKGGVKEVAPVEEDGAGW